MYIPGPGEGFGRSEGNFTILILRIFSSKINSKTPFSSHICKTGLCAKLSSKLLFNSSLFAFYPILGEQN
jgi:hypothetical protein